jgi:hypothetical protein
MQSRYVSPICWADMRCAITFVPPPDDRLTLSAAAWLGHDAYSGRRQLADVEGLTEADHSFLTALPRRAGFHATLKPPFELETGRSVHELERRLDEYVRHLRPTGLRLEIALIDSFYALVPTGPSPAIVKLAANIVAEFDSFRRPMTPEEFERRAAARYKPTQLANLAKWGSPFVFDHFTFHMTLTGPVPRNEREHVALVLERYFGSEPVEIEVDRLVLAVQDEVHEPYRIHSTHAFASELRIAS